jgi:hypothetical protein
MIEISELKPEDMDAAAVAFSAFFVEAKALGKYNPTFCSAYWKDLYANNRSVSLIAKDKSGAMVGIYAGILGLDPVTGTPTAYEAIWYVMPENKGLGIRMHRKWEEMCRKRGATRFMVGHSKNWQCLDMERLYSRLGYQPYEITYVKETT